MWRGVYSPTLAVGMRPRPPCASVALDRWLPASSAAQYHHKAASARPGRCAGALRPLQVTLSPLLPPPHAGRKLQRRWHGGHGHSHGIGALDDEEDEEAAALRKKLSAEDVKAADRITWIGVWMNVVLSAGKGVAGVAFHSSGLLADAVHSASDLASDAVTLVTLKYCARPPDARQPYGYGKYESIGALSVSLLLIGGSAGIVVHSFETLLALMQSSAAAAAVAESLAQVELATNDVAATSVSGGPESIHPAALAMAAVSVGAKEWLYRSTNAIGKRVNSSVLIANAWHHRSDAVTSIVAMAGIGLSLAGLPLFDPIAGMLVGGIILKMGGEIGLTSVRELCDAQLPASVVGALEEAARGVVLESEGEIREIRQLRSRRIGRHVHVDLTLVVDEGVSMHRACQWKERSKRSIKAAVPRVKDIIVELATPSQTPTTVFEQQRDDEEDAAMAMEHAHDHSHDHDGHHRDHEDSPESHDHEHSHEHNHEHSHERDLGDKR
jgi:cation diffusion facilitator family transporter